MLIALGGFLYSRKYLCPPFKRIYQAMPSGRTCSYTRIQCSRIHSKFYGECMMSSHESDAQRHSCELRIRSIQRCGKCQARLEQYWRHSQFLSYLTGISGIYSRAQIYTVFMGGGFYTTVDTDHWLTQRAMCNHKGLQKLLTSSSYQLVSLIAHT